MPLSIAILGGCHVDGFGVGVDRSFSRVLDSQLSLHGIESVVHLFPLFRLRDVEKLEDIVRNLRPDVFVLQLGNYESKPILRRRQRSGSRSGSSSSLSSSLSSLS